MSEIGIIRTILATELSEVLKKDYNIDIKNFGPETTKWLVLLADIIQNYTNHDYKS